MADVELRVNAWTGEEAPAGLARAAWALRKRANASISDLSLLRPEPSADESNWRHPEIGWGLVLPDREGLSPQDLAAGADAPAALQRLLSNRQGSPVLRWRADLKDGYLRRYYSDGKFADLSLSAGKRGVGRNCLPKYLLIYAEPSAIPWTSQYLMNMSAFVGRLTLTGEALETYVDCLISNWAGAAADARKPLIWTVDHGAPDITALMRKLITAPLWQQFQTDADLDGRAMLEEGGATIEALSAALAANKPGFIVTTSHGATGPLSDAASMKDQLGCPVDAEHRAVRPQALLGAWAPDGAIWFAQACCSAVIHGVSRYAALFAEDDRVGQLVRAVASGAGTCVAPTPLALLSAPKPLRAWIGRVEPTFDYTLRDPVTKQNLAIKLVEALHSKLYLANMTVGRALAEVYDEAGQFISAWPDAVERVNQGDLSYQHQALYRQLVAMDRQAIVILGDPTVTLAPY